MILYHGTASYNEQSFKERGIIKHPRQHYPKHSFCCSIDFKEAAFFALRKTPANDLSNTGVVLRIKTEFLFFETVDYIRFNDTHAIRNEKEIVVFSVNKLWIISVYKFSDGKWINKRWN